MTLPLQLSENNLIAHTPCDSLTGEALLNLVEWQICAKNSARSEPKGQHQERELLLD